MPHALIALGSNLGDRAATLNAAVDALRAEACVDVLRVSTWHETAPIGGPEGQGAYLNGAAVVETNLAPEQLLVRLQAIENSLGRKRDVRWGPRTLDLDLLLYDDVVHSSPTLVVPHPRMRDRRFVLEPACEVAPDWRHPESGLTLRDHLAQLSV